MKVTYNILLFLFLCTQLSGQNGLERIIVEKYYVSDENDTSVNGDGGELPVESVTYRVYVDMLPDYIFQAVYGVAEHELKIATSTNFFNNEDRGGRFPTYTRAQAQNNTVMLDSWLSVGAALKDYVGVLKDHDNGMNTIVNADGVLQGQHTQAGIPVSQEDGAILAVSEPVTVVGFFDTDLSVLDDYNEMPSPTIISTHDGAWSSLNGSTGIDSTENIVLIGQFTTDGIFEFELNLQIRNQTTLVAEKYVARNPGENEILFEGLIHIDSLNLMSATKDLVKLDDEVRVFPNPTSGSVTLEISDQITLTTPKNQFRIQSMNGAVLLTGNISDHVTELNLSGLAPGFYLLSFELDNKYQYSDKIVRIP